MEQTGTGDVEQGPVEDSHDVTGSPTLHLKVEQSGSATLVILNGELDLSSAPPLRELLAQMLSEDPPKRLVLDLSDLIYLDSTGLSVFVSAHKRATASRVEFCLANPNSSVKRLLLITALDQVFEIIDLSGPPATEPR